MSDRPDELAERCRKRERDQQWREQHLKDVAQLKSVIEGCAGKRMSPLWVAETMNLLAELSRIAAMASEDEELGLVTRGAELAFAGVQLARDEMRQALVSAAAVLDVELGVEHPVSRLCRAIVDLDQNEATMAAVDSAMVGAMRVICRQSDGVRRAVKRALKNGGA